MEGEETGAFKLISLLIYTVETERGVDKETIGSRDLNACHS